MTIASGGSRRGGPESVESRKYGIYIPGDSFLIYIAALKSEFSTCKNESRAIVKNHAGLYAIESTGKPIKMN